jgi:hypothetical protein
MSDPNVDYFQQDIISDENKRSTFMAVANSLKFSRGTESGWASTAAEQVSISQNFFPSVIYKF